MLTLAACSSDGEDAPPRLPAPSSLFVIGDSLSDVGNAAAAADYLLNLPLDPPTVGLCNPTDVLVAMRGCDDLFYRRSRVSNGPLAVESLATHLGLSPLKPSLHVLPNQARDGTVYAVASAKAAGVANEDLARQVDWLLLRHATLPADAAYVVIIGGNDAIDALQAELAGSAPGVAPSTAIIAAAVEAIGTQVERLLDFGARRLVVANVPELSELPAVRAEARASADEARVLATAIAISAAFNRALAAKLDEVEAGGAWPAPTPVIARFDLRAALSAARQAMAAKGANATDACFDTELYRGSSAERAFHADCAPPTADGAPRFDEFAFFDGIHPTGAVHAALGDALRALF